MKEHYYVVHHLQSQAVPWQTVLSSAASVLMLARMNLLEDLVQTAEQLFLCGISFRSCLPYHTSSMWKALPPHGQPGWITFGLEGFVLDDYSAYEHGLNDFLDNSLNVRAAALRGWILWRLVLQNPSG